MKFVGNVHLVRGSALALPELMSLLAAAGIETQANPDIDVRTYPQFLVEDARALTERALTRSVSGGRRVFITIAANLTYEAQNTLLKTLEEAPGDALFFFIVPSPEMLLPTVRSRAQLLELSTDAHAGVVDLEVFLKATPAVRLDMLKPLLAKDEDDVRDISGIVIFLSSLERILAKRVSLGREGLEAVYRARAYIGDKGSLLKALLEQVALLTPRV